jgi:SpoVK/Ycf46/Vps4 family AAA+-type ATPase
MTRTKTLVAERRKYLVTTVVQAKGITTAWLNDIQLDKVVSLGLPEVDDRYHIWRVPLCRKNNRTKIGEVVIDAYSTAVLSEKATRVELLEARLLQRGEDSERSKIRQKPVYKVSQLRNTIGQGDCVDF